MKKIDKDSSILIGISVAGIAILIALTIWLILSPSLRLKLMSDGLSSLIAIYLPIFSCCICLPILLRCKKKKKN